MTGTLTFTYSLDPAEQVRVSALVAKRGAGARLWRRIGIPLLVVPVVLALALGLPLSILRPYAVILVIIGVLALGAPVLQRWQAKRALAATPALAGPLTYRLAEEGIGLDTAISSIQLSWDGVEQAQETADLFVFYFAGRFAYYIPKRVTGTETDAVRALLRERLGARAEAVQSPVSVAVT